MNLNLLKQNGSELKNTPTYKLVFFALVVILTACNKSTSHKEAYRDKPLTYDNLVGTWYSLDDYNETLKIEKRTIYNDLFSIRSTRTGHTIGTYYINISDIAIPIDIDGDILIASNNDIELFTARAKIKSGIKDTLYLGDAIFVLNANPSEMPTPKKKPCDFNSALNSVTDANPDFYRIFLVKIKELDNKDFLIRGEVGANNCVVYSVSQSDCKATFVTQGTFNECDNYFDSISGVVVYEN